MNDAAETSACAPENAVPMDITLRVLGDLMNETMALMDETVSLGDQRNATGEAGPHEIAIGLRLAARLARVGGWLMAHSPTDASADPDEAMAARLAASLELHAASRGRLDGADQHGPILALATRIDRLVARACRLDAQFHPTAEPQADVASLRRATSVVSFPAAAEREPAGL